MNEEGNNAMKEKLGIYIHIPFCIKKCNYCDFLSVPATEEMQKRYIEALIREIKSYAMKLQPYEIETVYFGGGTPSAIDALGIRTIMKHLKESIGNSLVQKEVTIEVNPGTITKEKLKIYKEIGINRLSMGLQATENDRLKELGRIHTWEVFLENYYLARQCGFRNISIDLMSGLPNQTVEQWEGTLEKVIKLQPEHISAYGLMIEKGTPFYEKYSEGAPLKSQLPSEEDERKMYERTKEILEGACYYRYELSNYAKKGMESKHNSSYWTRRDYIGIGLGAASCFQGERYSNTCDMSQYCKKEFDFYKKRKEIENLSIKDRMEEFMFLGLRMTEGVEESGFLKEFSTTIEQIYGSTLDTLVKEGWMVREGGKIRLTDRGIDVSNVILAEFLMED